MYREYADYRFVLKEGLLIRVLLVAREKVSCP